MSPKVVELEKIKDVLKDIQVFPLIEKGFVEYSKGNVTVPPVGEMIFDNPPGECHIKYGFIKEDDYYVIKIASGFYENPKIGVSASNGLVLLFNQKTGELYCVLLDEGYLTNVRTAVAGAIAAKYFAPKNIKKVGIFGAGIQGRLQIHYLQEVLDCKDIIVWGIDQEELDKYKEDMQKHGYSVETTLNSEDITKQCKLIITCTPSKTPIIKSEQILAGTHITAVGSDTAEKQELDSAILKKADRVIVDSIEQCLERGESFKALANGHITKEKMVELGNAIIDKKLQRNSDEEITVVDLTGVAIQDIQIAKAVWQAIAPELQN